MSATTRPRWLGVLRALALALGVAQFVFFAYAAARRFRYPVELEWMSGSILEHVERVGRGEAIYVAPSASFIPFLYPPLYYWISAVVAKAVAVEAACRVVSVTATLISGVLVHRVARRLGATPFWALLAPALFFSGYSLTGFWYDLERADVLVVSMVLGGAVLLLERRELRWTALAGALVGGAFLAKQPASVFFVALAAGLSAGRSFRRATAFAAGGLALVVPAVGYLSASTDGWFWFYCVKMPASHGIDPKLLRVLLGDATKAFAITAATIFALVVFARQAVAALRRRAVLSDDDAVFGAVLAAAVFTSAASRLHVGGFLNVLILWTTVGSIAFAVAGSRLAATGTVAEGVLVTAAILQMAHLLYDPRDVSPDRSRLAAEKALERRVHAMEGRGEVILLGRGHVTSPRHFHAIALMDVLRAGLPIPPDLVDGLEQRRYAAVVIDEFGELSLEAMLGRRSDLFGLVARNYFVAQELDDRVRPPLVGWTAHPSWVLRPRTIPLGGTSPPALERRQILERAIAEMRMRSAQVGARPTDEDDDVEALAASADTAGSGR